VNVDNDTLRRILDNPRRLRPWSASRLALLGDNIIETIINKSEKVKELKAKPTTGS